MFAAFAAAAAVSCSKEIASADSADGPSLTIIAGNPSVQPSSKTEMDGVTPYWSVGDKIGVTDGSSANAQFTTSISAKAQTASFSGTTSALKNIYAYYPYTDSGVDASGVKAEIPSVQYPAAASFDGDADLMVSKQFTVTEADATVDGLEFARLGAVVKLVLKGADGLTADLSGQHPASVSLTAESSLAGQAHVTLDGLGELYDGLSTSVTAKYTSDTEYLINGSNATYLIVYPQTLTAGTSLTVKAVTEDYVIKRTVTVPDGGITLPAGTITTLGFTLSDDNVASDDDYYGLFALGEDITINDVAYNISSYPNPRLVTPENLTDGNELVKSVSENGILFIDDNANSTITITGRLHIRLPDVVVIGRYRTSQPTIDAGSLNMCPIGGDVVFKNIGYTSTNGYGFLFNNSRSDVTGNCTITVEDCTIKGTTTSSTSNSICRDGNSTYKYEKVVFNNCVIIAQRPIILHSSVDMTDFTTSLSLLKVTNSILHCPDGATATTARLILLDKNNSTLDFSNLEINMQNNTIYGIDQNPFFNIIGVKSVNINKNVFAGTLTKARYILALTTDVRETSTFTGNVFVDTASYGYFSCNSATKNHGVTNSPNDSRTSASLPFTTTDFTNGYLPIDTASVTDGSGCDYSTKLWKTWE